MVKTDAGIEYQEEILTKELKRLRKKLGDHLVSLNDLTGTRDISTVEEERKKLDRILG